MTSPLVSVYIPTKNRNHLVVEAIDSILQQTFRDIEIIVVDDGSIDDTAATLSRVQHEDKRVRVLRNQTSFGPSTARNQAIEAAAGVYVTGLDDDDLMLPNRIKELLDAKSPKNSLVCTGFLVEKNGKRKSLHNSNREISENDILHYNFVGNQALMLKAHVTAIGGFDPEMTASEDYDLWTRLIHRFGNAKRIRGATYVKREPSELPRLTRSPNFLLGAKRYTEKHRPRMNTAHLKSQKLIHIISAQKHVPLRAVPSVFAIKTLPILTKYILSTTFNDSSTHDTRN